jgi:hypothetical protein
LHLSPRAQDLSRAAPARTPATLTYFKLKGTCFKPKALYVRLNAGVFPDGAIQMKFADWLWFIAVIIGLFSPAIVGILDHI